MNKTYQKEKSPLYELNSRKKLLDLFSISDYKTLKTLSLDDGNYNVFEKQNKNKPNKRIIEEPINNLKKVHKDFNRLLQRTDVPNFVKAGRKGCCYIDNGLSHKNGKYFYCTDVEKFFPNTTRERVLQFLLYEMKMPKDITFLLSNLLTYNNHLPTGSPSSQLLTYWAYKKTFDDIYQKALLYEVTMTLFVDDLTFSSDKKIPELLIQYIKSKLASVGLSINKKKSKIYGKKDYKKVTGTIITPDNMIVVPNKLHHKIFLLRKKANKTEKELMSLKGMLNVVKQIKRISSC